jgi:hypothetical protein
LIRVAVIVPLVTLKIAWRDPGRRTASCPTSSSARRIINSLMPEIMHRSQPMKKGLARIGADFR